MCRPSQKDGQQERNNKPKLLVSLPADDTVDASAYHAEALQLDPSDLEYLGCREKVYYPAGNFPVDGLVQPCFMMCGLFTGRLRLVGGQEVHCCRRCKLLLDEKTAKQGKRKRPTLDSFDSLSQPNKQPRALEEVDATTERRDREKLLSLMEHTACSQLDMGFVQEEYGEMLKLVPNATTRQKLCAWIVADSKARERKAVEEERPREDDDRRMREAVAEAFCAAQDKLQFGMLVEKELSRVGQAPYNLHELASAVQRAQQIERQRAAAAAVNQLMLLLQQQPQQQHRQLQSGQAALLSAVTQQLLPPDLWGCKELRAGLELGRFMSHQASVFDAGMSQYGQVRARVKKSWEGQSGLDVY